MPILPHSKEKTIRRIFIQFFFFKISQNTRGIKEFERSNYWQCLLFSLAGSDNESYTSEHDESYKLMSEEDRRIADLGKPQLGEMNRLDVKIMESTEFKVCSGSLESVLRNLWIRRPHK